MSYTVLHENDTVIRPSNFFFEFTDQPTLKNGLNIVSTSADAFDSTWEQPWGEQRTIVDNGNQITVVLEETAKPNRLVHLIGRAYDDGVAWRYHFTKQVGRELVFIKEERTEMKLTGDHTSWWIPGDWDIYEHLYNTTPFSKIDALSKRDHPNLAQTYIPENAVNTPITMKTSDGLYLSFHEANLTDYSDMTLMVDAANLTLTSNLVGGRPEHKVERKLPFSTPWRTIQIAKKPGDLIESNLILNLNEPNKLGDVSWFTPMKYVGIWWEMHLGKSSWNFKSGRHGATTENAKKYIDFAAKNNIGGVLVEGWNTGWDHWIGFEDREGVFDFVTPYPDYNISEVVQYGKSKNIDIVMHHETSSAPRTYDQQLDTAFQLMESLDLHAVKSGYVGPIIPKGEYHHGQWMIQHYRKVIETAAKYDVAVNAHEPIKATGIRRTYPNVISREGLRGQEFNAWAKDGGNPPEHLSIIAFTRMLAGPIDFTPGVFNISLKPYKKENQINTTLAHQLALYVVVYSPVQMACDLLEYYENKDEFQFIRDVAVDWETSKVLDGEIGDFIVMARQARNSGNWFVGGITDENARTIDVDLSFLEGNTDYEAIIYRDGADAHFKDNPLSTEIETLDINSDKPLKVELAAGGGFAISIIKK